MAPVALVLAASACRLPERHDFSTRIEERTLELKPGGHFHAVAFNGSIEMEGWDRDEVHLVAKIREFREGEVRFSAESKDGNVTVRAEREFVREPSVRFGFGGSSGASYTVKIPRKAFATLYSSNGRIEIRRVDGEMDANTSNGPIIAEEVGAKARLTTSNGAISAAKIKGELYARTSNGGIDISDIFGEADISSSNGRIKAINVSGKMEATTSNASISVEKIGATSRLTTSNGAISAASIKGDVFARTSNGGIDVSDISGEADLRSSSGRIKARGVKGKIGAFTSNGSITADSIESDLIAKNTNGQIEINNVLGSIDAETSNASIKADGLDGKGRGIRLVTGIVQARTTDGNAITFGAPIAKQVVDDGAADAAGAKNAGREKNVLRAKVGNSDQLIDLRTTHGRITVR